MSHIRIKWRGAQSASREEGGRWKEEEEEEWGVWKQVSRPVSRLGGEQGWRRVRAKGAAECSELESVACQTLPQRAG